MLVSGEYKDDDVPEAEDGCVHVDQDAGGGGSGGAGCDLSPDRTPTNEAPSTPLLSGTHDHD